jgi:hypothetical protein
MSLRWVRFLELSMSPKEQNPAAFRPKRIRRSIKLDRVQASDYNKMMLIFACEHCSFFPLRMKNA